MTHTRITLVALALLGLAAPAFAQSNEHDETRQVRTEDLGPFRPERKADLAKARDLIVAQTNEFRRGEKLASVDVNETIQKTAQKFADYMARTDRYGHTADDRQPAERAAAQGYEYCLISENIAYQFRTTGFDTADLASRFVEGWKNSPGHRANMLQKHVTETGVAIAQSEKTGAYYAVQMFGRPKSEMIEFRVANPTGEAAVYRVGDQTYDLPPRVVRTHQVCQPADVTLVEDAGEGKKPKDFGPRLVPKNGDRFRIDRTADEVRLLKDDSPVEPAASKDR
ncbi:MAG: CAP domain-containing protein [Planctomycetaceae bacterium]|nr:CAP domain-containing protein [Planctomycetaceae bacterium]